MQNILTYTQVRESKHETREILDERFKYNRNPQLIPNVFRTVRFKMSCLLLENISHMAWIILLLSSLSLSYIYSYTHTHTHT